MTKPQDHRKIELYLDNLFRKCIHKRDTYRDCPCCKNPFNNFRSPDVMHFVKRRFTKTRWDMNNAILGCRICNTLDVDIAPVLESRGVDTFKLMVKGKSFGKVDYDAVQQELERYLG